MRIAVSSIRGAARMAVACAGLAVALTSCAEKYESGSELTKQDYKDLLDRTPPVAAKRPEPPIPDLQPILAAPATPAAETRLVSVSVTETTPLKDLLIELARKAEMDVELDPGISGGVIFTAHDRPFIEVVERIADLGGLRFELKNNILRVERDTPFHKTYRVEKVNQSRDSENVIGTNTNVFSSVKSSGGGSADSNASSSKVTSKSESDFWKELDSNLKQILVNSQTGSAMLSGQTPAAPAPAPAPAPAANAMPAGEPMVAGSAAPVMAAAQGAASATAGAAQQATTAVVAAAAAPATGNGTAPSFYSVNKQAGLISVYGTNKQQKKVEEYLNQVKAAASAQVLIEAKIIEVSLSDEFRSGVNWQALIDKHFGISAPFSMSPTSYGPTFGARPTDNFVTLGFSDGNFGSLLNFAQNFGTVRTLSSPRLTVVNNETAILKVAQNEVYFSLAVNQTPATTTSAGIITIQSTVNTVPIGVIMTVQPVINIETNEVSLGLRPTLSRIVEKVEDPGVQLQTALIKAQNINVDVSQIKSEVPIVEVREMDSVVTIPSGDIVVMGGLMQERAKNDSRGVPGLQEIPVAGNLFKARQDRTELTELVILLKATVVQGSNSVHAADKELYRKFGKDPRPLGF